MRLIEATDEGRGERARRERWGGDVQDYVADRFTGLSATCLAGGVSGGNWWLEVTAKGWDRGHAELGATAGVNVTWVAGNKVRISRPWLHVFAGALGAKWPGQRGPRAVTSVASRDPRRVACPGLAPAEAAFSSDGTGKPCQLFFFSSRQLEFPTSPSRRSLSPASLYPGSITRRRQSGTRLGDGASSCGR